MMEAEGYILLECMGCGQQRIASEKEWNDGMIFVCFACRKNRFKKVLKYIVFEKDAFKDWPVGALVIEVGDKAARIYGFDSKEGYLEHPVTIALRPTPPRVDKEGENS